MGSTNVCKVMGCGNSRKKCWNISYFKFPNDEDTTKKWCSNLEINPGEISKYSVVCMNHFTADQFHNIQKSKLKKSAMPTLILPQTEINGPSPYIGHFPLILPKHHTDQNTGHMPPHEPSSILSTERACNLEELGSQKLNDQPANKATTNDENIPSPLTKNNGPSPDIGHLPLTSAVQTLTPLTTYNGSYLRPFGSHKSNVSPANQGTTSDENIPPPLTKINGPSPYIGYLPLTRSVVQTLSPLTTNKEQYMSRIGSSKSVNSTSSTPSPIRKKRILVRKVHALTQQNCRLRKRLCFADDVSKTCTFKSKIPTNQLAELFGHDTSMIELITSQWNRYSGLRFRRYTDMEKVIAFTLYYRCGSKGYRCLQRLGLKLPSINSIQRWLRHFKVKTGLNDCIFDCIKNEVSKMNEFEKICIIVWDEMRIKQYLLYNQNTDEVEGVTDHGEGRRELTAAKEALVFMARGMNTKWTFPVSFYFSSECTKTEDLYEIVQQNITRLQSIGLNIRVAVCDQGIGNQGLYRWLGINPAKPFYEFNDKRIYFIHDICHIVKLVRTHLQRHGFKIGNEYALWSIINKFYDIDSSTECRLAPKLSKYHLKLTELSRMKVKLATQLLSNSVAAGIRTLVKLKLLNEKENITLGTANFVEKMNSVFDMLNISQKSDLVNPRKSGSTILNRVDELQHFLDWVKLWECADGAAMPDCWYGFQLTLRGMIDLMTDLKEDKYGYLFTRRIQQDCIEHYFSFQRGRSGYCNNPTTVQFQQNFKFLFLTALVQNSPGANCERFDDDTQSLQAVCNKVKHILEKQKDGHSPLNNGHLPSSSDEFEEDEEQKNYKDFFGINRKVNLGDKDENVAVYLGGRVVKKITQKTNCNICKQMLEFPSSHYEFEKWEILMYEKAFNKGFNNAKEYSFSQILNKKSKLIFDHINQFFRIALVETFNDAGVNICKNMISRLVTDSIISDWLNENDDCKAHKISMLSLFIRIKLHHLIRCKNETYKAVRSVKQTREDLRHQ